jgi:hypothetical protein
VDVVVRLRRRSIGNHRLKAWYPRSGGSTQGSAVREAAEAVDIAVNNFSGSPHVYFGFKRGEL